MKHLVRMALLVLALVAGAAMPAAAETDDSRMRNWSEAGPSFFIRAEQPEPRRASRAARYTYDDEDGAPRRRTASRAHQGRHAHRQAAGSDKATRGHRAADRSGKSPKAVVKQETQKPAVAAAKPEAQPAEKEQKGATTAEREKKSAKPEKKAAVPAPEPAPKAQAARPAGGQHGVASYYWQPQRVASGGWFDPNAMTAAHKTLPFGTRVRVTHLGNGRSVEVRINDRGPYVAGRIIDLSKAAAAVIGMTGQGIARVAVEVVGR